MHTDTLDASDRYAQKPAVMQRRRRGSILRSMSKQMEERVALLGLSKAGKTTLVEQLAHADPIKITNPPTTPHDGTLHTHNPTDNMMMVRPSEPHQTNLSDGASALTWKRCLPIR
jgi:hypothetical protein